MKIRLLLLRLLAVILALAPARAVHSAQAPKLETLLAEYKKARTDVLAKLNEAYATQGDALAQAYAQLPNLDGVDRAKRFAKRLRDSDEKNDLEGVVVNDAATDPLAQLQNSYVRAREENLRNVYTFYTTTAQNLHNELTRSKDTAGAQVMAAFLEKIKPPADPHPPKSAPKKVQGSAAVKGQ